MYIIFEVKVMENKIVLITGATGGIGKAAAFELARQGARVIIHGRNAVRATVVQQEILSTHPHAQVDILIADLFLQSEVRRMANDFLSRYDRLDVLINNAGCMIGNQREVTSEGHERMLALNLFAPFLLTALLMPALRNSASARIINVSSSSHRETARPDFNDLAGERNYAPLRTYGNSKLFLILVSQWLVHRLHSLGVRHVSVNTVHPGAVASEFLNGKDLGALLNFAMKTFRFLFKTPEQGADTLVFLASSPAVESITGKYFINRKPARVAARYNSRQNEEVVWQFCEEKTGVAL